MSILANSAMGTPENQDSALSNQVTFVSQTPDAFAALDGKEFRTRWVSFDDDDRDSGARAQQRDPKRETTHSSPSPASSSKSTNSSSNSSSASAASSRQTSP